MPVYPRDREPYFAHRFCRLLAKTCAALEIGADACFLLTTISHLEDVKRYKAPVQFFNDQLAAILGVSAASMDRIRKKCIQAGWLHYEPGGKGKVGRYWVEVPPHAACLDDSPIDEGQIGDLPPQICEGKREESEKESDLPSQKWGDKFEVGNLPPQICEEKRETSEEHSSLSLSLNTKTNTQCVAVDSKIESDLERYQSDPLAFEAAFLDEWNKSPGTIPYEGPALSSIRARELRERLHEPDWNWRAALARFPLNWSHGKPTIGWFLKPTSVPDVLEGKFEFLKRAGPTQGKKRSNLDDEFARLCQRVAQIPNPTARRKEMALT